MIIELSDDLAWVDYDIPDSNLPVELVRLESAPPSHGFTSFVRFPRGWQRRVAGSYVSNEEFIVLDGKLEMNGTIYSAGEWVFVPAGAERSNTSTPVGALTVAWFHGPGSVDIRYRRRFGR